MRPTFLARLVNGPRFDPVVFVRLLNRKNSIMFDCGRFEGLSNREVLSLEAVFISHTHMDHFMGFDHILRIILHREGSLHVYGPEGIRDRVIARLGSYTWNLTGDYPLEIVIHEVREHEVIVCSARAREGFRPTPPVALPRTGQVLVSRARYSVEGILLDHDVPCLGFVLKEPFHIHVKSNTLAAKGYCSGPWIGELKEKIMTGSMDDAVTVTTTRGSSSRKVTDLMHELIVTSAGQKIAYITDIRASGANIEKVGRVAQGVDILFIEAYYMSEHEKEAFAKAHLTARQAGMIARRIGARKVVPMHISPRYHGRVGEVIEELETARNGAQSLISV